MIKHTREFVHSIRRTYHGNSHEYVLDSFRDSLEGVPETAIINIHISYEIADEPEAQK